jgi:hypothetical protein
VGWIDQVVPSQCSARVRSWEVLVMKYPTAVQSAAAGQEALRLAPAAPAGVGAGWIDQADPFHRSARTPA